MLICFINHFQNSTYFLYQPFSYVSSLCSSGSVQQILDAHLHYVQGVALDPLGKYAASLSSDRSCRIYAYKPPTKVKNSEKMTYVCQHVITKAENVAVDDSKVENVKSIPVVQAVSILILPVLTVSSILNIAVCQKPSLS